jgi:hypothetical protein
MDHYPFDKPGKSAIMQPNPEVPMKDTRSSIAIVVVTNALLPVVVGEELQPVG